MNKRLLLMRHAQAETSTVKTTDFERHLTRCGLAQASEMAETLKNLNYSPDAILHSSALRTTQTAQQIVNTTAGKSPVMISEKVLYNAIPETITETIQIAALPENIHTLLVIAHNPGISWLATECGWKDHSIMYFPTAGIAAFDLSIQNWIDFRPPSCKYLFFKTPAANP